MQARQASKAEKKAALVIGAGGGIGHALLQQLVADGRYAKIYAVSRKKIVQPLAGVTCQQLDSEEEDQIQTFCASLGEGEVALAICCIGALHEKPSGAAPLMPEKRLEELNAAQLQRYFQVNSILPALWLKHLLPVLKSTTPASVTMLSARVGSIADNRLGGWYGYRASKAALNMLVKTAQVEYRRRAGNVSLLCYHPGTVDTCLSEPFQQNVPAGKLFAPAFTAARLLDILTTLAAEQSPYFLDWDGKAIPW